MLQLVYVLGLSYGLLTIRVVAYYFINYQLNTRQLVVFYCFSLSGCRQALNAWHAFIARVILLKEPLTVSEVADVSYPHQYIYTHYSFLTSAAAAAAAVYIFISWA